MNHFIRIITRNSTLEAFNEDRPVRIERTGKDVLEFECLGLGSRGAIIKVSEYNTSNGGAIRTQEMQFELTKRKRLIPLTSDNYFSPRRQLLFPLLKNQ